jgi:hypothetical protein
MTGTRTASLLFMQLWEKYPVARRAGRQRVVEIGPRYAQMRVDGAALGAITHVGPRG